MLRFFFLLFVFLTPVCMFGNDLFRITIHGVFPGAEGREIRLMEYSDQISYRENEIAADIVDDQGNFSFQFSRFQTQYYFFRIDHARMGFFAEPGNEYQILFERVDFNGLDDRANPYIHPWFFEFDVKGNNLNRKIDSLEDVIYDYLSDRFVLMRTSRNVNIFDDLQLKTDSLFGHIENPYFRDYYRYKFGYYQYTSNLVSFRDMLREYILGQPVLYQNTQYMNLFNIAFDKFIFAGSRRITLSDLRHTVNTLNSYHALMDSLGKDTLLRNEVIRELVMLKGLGQMHGNPDYNRENVESILQYTAQNSKFPEHRTIAANILHGRTYLKNGSPLPGYDFTDAMGNKVNLPDGFKDKYLYIVFWASWCETCIMEFAALREIQSQFGNDFSIVAISTDRDKKAFNDFVSRNDLPWSTFHFNNDFRMLDAYHIRAMPTYMLVDRQGKILNFPASAPSGDIFNRIEFLLHQERRPPSGRRR